jgi:glucose-6-phosphate isomerase
MNSQTAYFPPFAVDFDLQAGIMLNPDRSKSTRASTMIPYYRDRAAIEALAADGDPIHYEVFEKNIPTEAGHIMICISKLLPGKIGDEFFMTKGHYHQRIATAETYLCLRGEGVMLMKTPEGEVRAETFRPGRMVYVPPCWAHRSINTGREALITFCNYPADAGLNYGDILTEGFPKRVVARDGGFALVPKEG